MGIKVTKMQGCGNDFVIIDYDEFLKRLLEVKSDKSKIESYGKKSRKIIDDNYNIDDYVEKIISIYDK